jgi:hypothetical protein
MALPLQGLEKVHIHFAARQPPGPPPALDNDFVAATSFIQSPLPNRYCGPAFCRQVMDSAHARKGKAGARTTLNRNFALTWHQECVIMPPLTVEIPSKFDLVTILPVSFQGIERYI